jgi:hypothetical protein
VHDEGRRIDLETHRAVVTWILQILATADLIKGKTIGIDATTLEANAALRSIARRDSGETYHEFLTRLAQASGIETPSEAIDLGSIGGRFMCQILAAVAELERGLISERVRLGLSRARAHGKTLGRPRLSVTDDQLRSVDNLSLRLPAETLRVSKSHVARWRRQRKAAWRNAFFRRQFIPAGSLRAPPSFVY